MNKNVILIGIILGLILAFILYLSKKSSAAITTASDLESVSTSDLDVVSTSDMESVSTPEPVNMFSPEPISSSEPEPISISDPEHEQTESSYLEQLSEHWIGSWSLFANLFGSVSASEQEQPEPPELTNNGECRDTGKCSNKQHLWENMV